MTSQAKSVDEYLDALSADRREALSAVRAIILQTLPQGVEEGMSYGMPGYFVPHSVYPPGYHCDPKRPLPFLGFASQKNHMSLYLFCCYCDETAVGDFAAKWKQTGKKLDMGKACVRFKKLEDLALEVIGETIASMPLERFIPVYEKALPAGKRMKS